MKLTYDRERMDAINWCRVANAPELAKIIRDTTAEDCCKAVCVDCASEIPVMFIENTGRWVHKKRFRVPCNAAAIREMMR